MESRNIVKALSKREKSKRIALSEVSNTQKSTVKESEVIKRWLQSDSRDSDSSRVQTGSPSTATENNEKDSTMQETVVVSTREINIPTPRKVVSPTKVTWYYSPRVVIPIVTPPEVTVTKPNLEVMRPNENSLATIKKNSKKSKSNTKKSQHNNNSSLLNWFGPPSSSDGQQSGSDKPSISQNEGITISQNIQTVSRPIANIKKRPDPVSNAPVTPLPNLESVDLGAIDMNLITDMLRFYDFIVKFGNPMELDLEYNGDKLKYVHLEEMILDDRFHTRLAYLHIELLFFLYRESEENCDIDIINLQYYLIERFPNRKFLCEKDYSEFSPRERMSLLVDLMNEALRTNKLREFVKGLTVWSNHKKENDIRTEKMKEIKFKINEIRVKVVNKENEIKDIEKQLEERTVKFGNGINDAMDLQSVVANRQKMVAKRKIEQEFSERRKDAADEIELQLHRLDKLETECKELDMLNKTERDHSNCTLRGGSVLSPSGRDERFYTVVRLGQDRNGRCYWFFRTLGGIFVETVKWNYPEQDSDNSPLPLTSPSEWQFISGIGIFRMFMTALNMLDKREKFLKTNLKVLEKEIEPTFDKLNIWLNKKRDVIKIEKMEVDSEEVKSIMSQHQKSFWKLFDTVIRKKNVWSLEEYNVIMEEYVKRKITEFVKILREVDPNLIFEDFQSSSSINASDFVSEVKDMISKTGLKFTDNTTASSKKDKNWSWLYTAAVDWYSLDIKTFSTLAVWLDVMVEAGGPVARSIKRHMQEQLAEKLKCSTRLRTKKKIVKYKEENEDDEIEDNNVEEQKPPSKWSLRERKRIAYK